MQKIHSEEIKNKTLDRQSSPSGECDPLYVLDPFWILHIYT